MSGVIYLIRNLKNGKCYIGKTTDLKNRIRLHSESHSQFPRFFLQFFSSVPIFLSLYTLEEVR